MNNMIFSTWLTLTIILALSHGYRIASFHSLKQSKCGSFQRTAVKAVALPKDIPMTVGKTLFSRLKNTAPLVKIASKMPASLKNFISSIYPGQLLFLLIFQSVYRKIFRVAHKWQSYLWKLLSFGTPYDWEKSICKFAEDRCFSLSKLISFNYAVKIFFVVLAQLGLTIQKELLVLVSKILYTMYFTQFFDRFKSQFLPTFLPKVSESRRQTYMVDQSSSVFIWAMGILIVCEMVSTYLKIPLSSTLAFGGVGGLAIGLAARDMAANFLGGMLLLFNEPFTPGDFVTFSTGGGEIIGRVERVGWSQTRVRGKDTRPTYIPNSHFVQTAVTNMERITHRKFETTVPIRFQDYKKVIKVLDKVKERLRTIPKLDVLSMPFRVHFVRIGPHYLELEIMCYFMTKSIDEFLNLQQSANLEILESIYESGAQLAIPVGKLQMENAANMMDISQEMTPNVITPSVNEIKPPPVVNATVVKETKEEKKKDVEFQDITRSRFKSVLDDFYKGTKPVKPNRNEDNKRKDKIRDDENIITVDHITPTNRPLERENIKYKVISSSELNSSDVLDTTPVNFEAKDGDAFSMFSSIKSRQNEEDAITPKVVDTRNSFIGLDDKPVIDAREIGSSPPKRYKKDTSEVSLFKTLQQEQHMGEIIPEIDRKLLETQDNTTIKEENFWRNRAKNARIETDLHEYLTEEGTIHMDYLVDEPADSISSKQKNIYAGATASTNWDEEENQDIQEKSNFELTTEDYNSRIVNSTGKINKEDEPKLRKTGDEQAAS